MARNTALPYHSMPSPTSGVTTRRSATRSDPATPTLKLLQQGMGACADLLKRIPIDRVEMAQDCQVADHMPYRIFVGSVKTGSGWHDAWACLAVDSKGQRLPQMTIFSGPPSGAFTKHPTIVLDDPAIGKWNDTFGSFAISYRSVVVKICFVLKGIQFPPTTQFSAEGLRLLKAACKSIAPEDPRGLSESEPTPTFPRASLYHQPMQARKSQQHIPSQQVFKPLHDLSPLGLAESPKKPEAYGCKKGQAAAIDLSSESTSDQTPDLPKASSTSKDPGDKALRHGFTMDHLAASLPASPSEDRERRSRPKSRMPENETVPAQPAEKDILKDTIERPYLFIARQYIPLQAGITASDLEAHFQAYNLVSVRYDELGWYITFETSKQGNDAAVRCYQECHLQKMHNFVMNMEINEYNDGPAYEHPQPKLRPNRPAITTEHTKVPTSTNVAAASMKAPTTVTPPPGEQVMQQLALEKVGKYQALINQRDSLETQFNRESIEAQEIKNHYDERRKNMAHMIDVEMLARHKEETALGRKKFDNRRAQIRHNRETIQRHEEDIQRRIDEAQHLKDENQRLRSENDASSDELTSRQKAEVAAEKNKYQVLKGEALAHEREADKKLGAIEQQKQTVVRDIESLEKNLSREDLLAFVRGDTPNKRRKLENKEARTD